MKNFLKPTLKKIIILVIFILLSVSFVGWSLNNSGNSSQDKSFLMIVSYIFTRPAMSTLDTFTGSMLKSESCTSIFCLLSVPEMVFTGVFDLIMLYIVSCSIYFIWNKKT